LYIGKGVCFLLFSAECESSVFVKLKRKESMTVGDAGVGGVGGGVGEGGGFNLYELLFTSTGQPKLSVQQNRRGSKTIYT
jgi:hypothetical protein